MTYPDISRLREQVASFSSKRIQQEAIVTGSSQSWLSFIQSEKVADRIANDVVRYLARNGINKQRKHLIQIGPDHHYTGTWRVTVLLPGPGLHNDESVKKREAKERSLAIEALRAALKNGDLVTSWSDG